MHQYSLTPRYMVRYWAKSEKEKIHDWLNRPARLNYIRANDKEVPDKTKAVENATFSEYQKKRVLKSLDWFFFICQKEGRKIGFVTLTLSGKQAHSTAVLNNLMLNQFLTELRAKTPVNRYVWKLEYQKNGNVHYHILIDCFVQWQIIRGIWNRIQRKAGYIDQFRDKFKNMTVQDYVQYAVRTSKVDTHKAVSNYRTNVKNRWSNPNSVDVHSVDRVKNIRAYVAKYMAKANNAKSLLTVDFVENNKDKFRSFGCSRSVSVLKSIVVDCNYKWMSIFDNLERAGGRLIDSDWFKILILNDKGSGKRIVDDYQRRLFGLIYDLIQDKPPARFEIISP